MCPLTFTGQEPLSREEGQEKGLGVRGVSLLAGNVLIVILECMLINNTYG